MSDEEKEIVNILRQIEAEELVRVVRCKDCKWSNIEKVFKNVSTSKETVRWCELITRYVDDDWFCADGERRTDDARP